MESTKWRSQAKTRPVAKLFKPRWQLEARLLELGGKAPNIVFADADIDAALRRYHRYLLQPRSSLLRRLQTVLGKSS